MDESPPPDRARTIGYRGRFAPTPSGPLHLGSLFTALAGYLEARSRGGVWLLRVDDLDPNRSRPEAADDIRRALEAIGLAWDGPVLLQSHRAEAYVGALARLQAAGLIYPCICSRKELATVSGEAPLYPGFCRGRRPGSVQEPEALRVRVPNADIGFRDRVQGPVSQNLATEVGDFILFRRDGVHAYHLATVLDDAEQDITDVLRGVDLLNSTPRQIFLQEQLGLDPTSYAHLPILVDPGGNKLGKSTLTPAASIRNPGALLFRLLRLLEQGPPAELAAAPAADLLAWAIDHWDITRLAGRRAIVVDP